jgi:predicted alpha/beta-fold hydrolase
MTSKPVTYQAPWWLKGGHVQTVWSQTLKIDTPHYERKLLPTSCGRTQVAYDLLPSHQANAPVVVLFHGLEGSSHSHYAKLLMQHCQTRGWHGAVPHYRGCGNVANTSHVSYHSGDSQEIAWMLTQIQSLFPSSPILAMGVSLGGNALAKYLGEQGHQALPTAAAVISAPLDLSAAAEALNHGLSKTLYAPYFLKSLRPKAQAQKPYINNSKIHWQALQQAKTLLDFDDAFTAPLNGFVDAQDYYHQSSAKPWLMHIQKPSLVINAVNDPFLPASALPTAKDVSKQVCLLQPKEGGHVGFIHGRFPGQANWLPQTVLDFFTNHLPQAK